eukprot:Pgem_evm1s10258
MCYNKFADDCFKSLVAALSKWHASENMNIVDENNKPLLITRQNLIDYYSEISKLSHRMQ